MGLVKWLHNLAHTYRDQTLHIKRRLYANTTFEELSRLHDASFRNYRIRDVIARAETYSEWLLADIHELILLINKRERMRPELWQAEVIPYSGVRDYYTAEASKGKGNMDPVFRRVEELFHSWNRTVFQQPAEAVVFEQQLLQAAESWKSTVSQIKSNLDYGLTSHARRFEETAPHFILEDVRWLMRMIKILVLESDSDLTAVARIQQLFQPILNHYLIPRGINQKLSAAFKTHDIDTLWENLHAIIREIIDDAPNLPRLLGEGVSTIFKDLSTMKKDLAIRDKRMRFNRLVNEWILVDALLRGWPSFFLTTKELKELYDKWVAEVRETIWGEIRFQLLLRKTMIWPLLEGNIAFSVAFDKNTVHITPLHGINANAYAVVYGRRIGTPHYILPWKYREQPLNQPTGPALERVDHLLSTFRKLLHEGNVQQAASTMTLALIAHPVRACAAFFEIIWSNLGHIRDPKLESSELLQRALVLFEHKDRRQEGIQLLEEFVSNYPETLADPYVVLASEKYLGQIRSLEEQRNREIQEYKDRLQEIDKAARRNQLTQTVVGIALSQNEITLDQLGLVQQNFLLFNRLSGISPLDILNDLESIIHDVGATSSLAIGPFYLQAIAVFFKQALERETKANQKKIQDIEKRISNALDKLWRDLPNNSLFQKALQLDPKYAEEILRRKAVFRSGKFQLEYEPYFDLNKANSKMKIGMYLWTWVSELKEVHVRRLGPIARAFKDRLQHIREEPLGISTEETKRIDQLTEHKIERIVATPNKEDSLVQLDLLSEAENLASSFINEAANLYEKSHAMLPSFSPSYMKAIELRCILMPLYQDAIRKLIKSKPPLEMALATDNFRIEYDTEIQGRLIPFDIKVEDENRITAYANDETILASIRFDSRDKKLVEHLTRSVQNPGFRKQLFPLSSSLATRMLKTPIPPSPQAFSVLKILENLNYPLTLTLAYMYARMTPPLTDQAYGVKVQRSLLKAFRDDALYTKESRKKMNEYLDTLDQSMPVEMISLDIEKVLHEMHISG